MEILWWCDLRSLKNSVLQQTEIYQVYNLFYLIHFPEITTQKLNFLLYQQNKIAKAFSKGSMYGKLPPAPTPRVCYHLVDKTFTFVVKRHLCKSRRDKVRMNKKAVIFTAVITLLISSNKLFQDWTMKKDPVMSSVFRAPHSSITSY